MGVTHSKVSAKSDSGDTTLVRPSDWNADHVKTFDGAGVQRTTSQTLTSINTWYAIDFTATDLKDAAGLHDPSSNSTRITLNKVGAWRVLCSVGWSATTTAGRRILGVVLNAAGAGSPTGATERTHEHSTQNIAHRQMGEWVVQATAITDYVEVYAAQNNGASYTFTEAECWVEFLGA